MLQAWSNSNPKSDVSEKVSDANLLEIYEILTKYLPDMKVFHEFDMENITRVYECDIFISNEWKTSYQGDI